MARVCDLDVSLSCRWGVEVTDKEQSLHAVACYWQVCWINECVVNTKWMNSEMEQPMPIAVIFQLFVAAQSFFIPLCSRHVHRFDAPVCSQGLCGLLCNLLAANVLHVQLSCIS